MKEQRNLEFFIKVNEILRFGCWSLDNTQSTHTELFSTGSHYFLFTFKREGDIRYRRLRELKRGDYSAEITKIVRLRPHKNCENWTDKSNRYELKRFRNYNWKKIIPADCCEFITPDGFQDLYNKGSLETSTLSVALKEEKKQQIQKAMKLASELGIAYENVCAIGTGDVAKLKAFKISYIRALELIKKFSSREVFAVYRNFKSHEKGDGQEQALEQLKIQIYGAKPYKMNFSELEKALFKRVEAYRKESMTTAIHIGTNKPYEERKQLYMRMNSLSREEKKKLLKELGVDTDAIDINTFSLTPIKVALAASVGINLEKF